MNSLVKTKVFMLDGGSAALPKLSLPCSEGGEPSQDAIEEFNANRGDICPANSHIESVKALSSENVAQRRTPRNGHATLRVLPRPQTSSVS